MSWALHINSCSHIGFRPPDSSDKCRARKWRRGAQGEFPSRSPLTAAWQQNLPSQLRIPMHTILVHNLPPVATRLPQHPRCQRLRMSRNQTRTKRLMRNPQSRAATPSRSKIIPWKVLPRPRPLAAPHPSHARASPVCTPVTPFLTSALHTAYRSPRRAPRARTAHTGIQGQ